MIGGIRTERPQKCYFCHARASEVINHIPQCDACTVRYDRDTREDHEKAKRSAWIGR